MTNHLNLEVLVSRRQEAQPRSDRLFHSTRKSQDHPGTNASYRPHAGAQNLRWPLGLNCGRDCHGWRFTVFQTADDAVQATGNPALFQIHVAVGGFTGFETYSSVHGSSPRPQSTTVQYWRTGSGGGSCKNAPVFQNATD